MSDVGSCYWLLGDDRLQLANDPRKSGQFQAHFKHSLLFHDRLILSDSFACNNRNFRLALRDDTFRDLISNDTLQLAVRRAADGSVENLAERATKFLSAGTQGFERAEYEHLAELEFLDNHLAEAKIGFNVGDATRAFMVGACANIYSGGLSEEIDPAIAQYVADRTREHVENGVLLRAFYYYDLLKEIDNKFGSAKREACHQTIKDYIDGPYFLGLSTLLRLNPVYAARHKRPIDISRRRKYGAPEDLCYDEFDTTLGFAAFAKGLSWLDSEAIFRLRELGVAHFLRSKLRTYDGAPSSAREIRELIVEYLARIEEEIIRSYPGLTSESTDGRTKQWRLSLDKVWETVGVATEGMSLIVASGLLSFAGMDALSHLLSAPVQILSKSTAEMLGLKSEATRTYEETMRRNDKLSHQKEMIREREFSPAPQDEANTIREVLSVPFRYGGAPAETWEGHYTQVTQRVD